MLLLFEIIALVILMLYCIQIGFFYFGLKRLKRDEYKNETQDFLALSIVVVYRNEGKNLPQLLNSISKLKYPNNKIELILVNDDSSDNSREIAEGFKNQSAIHCLLVESRDGKKAGIALGVKMAQNPILLFTDADCILPQNWLIAMCSPLKNLDIKMVLGPVAFMQSEKFLLKVFALEFMSLMASTAGANGIGKSIMANGANYAIRKSVFQSLSEDYQQKKHASGDDMFLLSAIKKIQTKANEIHFCFSPMAEVLTESPGNFPEFISQRIRWFSKSKAYTDASIIASALVVGLANLFLLFSMMLIPFGLSGWFILVLFALKGFFDFQLLNAYAEHFKKQIPRSSFLLLLFIYPLYVIAISALALIYKPKWKGRAIR